MSRAVRVIHAVRAGAAVALVLASAAAAPAAAQEAVPTRLVVRVLANDAKIIGTGVGGVQVVVRDAATGAVLAQGLQTGGTGDTGRIMNPRERGGTVFDTEGAAAFRAEIPLTVPTNVVIEYSGPLGNPQGVHHGSTSLLMLPGEHLGGEGVLVTLNGFTVEILSPGPGPFVADGGDEVQVRAKITLLCGCPTQPGGLWDSDQYEIRAQWVRAGAVVAETPMAYAGTTSEYTATLAAPGEAGPVTLRVTAVDRGRANTGMAEATGLVR